MGQERIIEYNGIALNIRDWAIRTNLNRATISVRLYKGWTIGQALGYEPPPYRKKRIQKITEEQKQKVVEMYKQGVKVIDISIAVNVGEQSIGKILRENGIERRKEYKSGENRKPQKQRNSQPCWDCGKYAGGCSWSRDFIPVEGWTAEKVIMTSGTETYSIKECPEFESDLWRYKNV